MLKFSNHAASRHLKTTILSCGWPYWGSHILACGSSALRSNSSLPLKYMLFHDWVRNDPVPSVGLVPWTVMFRLFASNSRLSARAGMLSALTGLAVAALDIPEGRRVSERYGPRGTVFGLLLFVLIIWSRHEARMLLAHLSAAVRRLRFMVQEIPGVNL